MKKFFIIISIYIFSYPIFPLALDLSCSDNKNIGFYWGANENETSFDYQPTLFEPLTFDMFIEVDDKSGKFQFLILKLSEDDIPIRLGCRKGRITTEGRSYSCDDNSITQTHISINDSTYNFVKSRNEGATYFIQNYTPPPIMISYGSCSFK